MITAQCDLYAAVNTPFNLYAAVNTPFFLSRFSSHFFSLYSSFHFTYWFQSLFERESEQSIWSQFRDTYTAAAPSFFSTSTPQWIRHLFITFITFTHHFTLFIAVGRFLLFFTYFTHHFTCFCLQVDSNNNSLIERAELRAAVARRLGKDPSDQLLDAMVAALHDNIFLYFSFSSWHVKIIIKSKKQNRTKSVAIECGHHGVEKIIYAYFSLLLIYFAHKNVW